jgi:hypothetical protein
VVTKVPRHARGTARSGCRRLPCGTPWHRTSVVSRVAEHLVVLRR